MREQLEGRVRDLWAEGLTISEIAERCHTNVHMVTNIRVRLDLPPRRSPPVKVPMPEGFERIASHAEHLMDVVAHYRTSRHTAKRWFAEAGIPLPNPAAAPLVVPRDWAEKAPTMTIYDGIKYFGMPYNRLKSMIRKTGVKFKPAPSTPRRGVVSKMGRAHSGVYVQALSTLADQAANVLRHYHSNVHRADIFLSDVSKETWGSRRGLPRRGAGQYFVAGIGVVTEEAMIELARKKGAKL